MCEKYSFTENIGILYHFLDGYLYSGTGSNYAAHKQLLEELGINIQPRVTQFETNKTLPFIHASKFGNNIDSFRTRFIKTIDIYLKMFNSKTSQIHITTTSRHQITFLRSIIRNKQNKNNKKYYLSIVNSGAGIKNHHSNGDNYNIWHTYICDSDITVYRADPLFYMLPLLEVCACSTFNISNETEKSTLIYIIGQCINLYTPHEGLNREIIDKIINGLDFRLIREQKNDLYINLFYEITNALLGSPVETIGTIFSEADTDIFVTEWDKLRAVKIQTTNSQIYKRDIIKDSGYLLTSPQKSGSCAWFSFFWAVFAYYFKTDTAINFIKNIDDSFSVRLNEIFRADCLNTVTDIDTEKLEHPYYTLNNLLIQQELIDADTSANKLKRILTEKLVIKEYLPLIETNDPIIFNCENAIIEAFRIAQKIRTSEVEIINTKIREYINTYLNDAFLYIKNIDKSLFGEIIINLFTLYHIYINLKYNPLGENDANIETDLLNATYRPLLNNNLFILLTKKETHRCRYIYNMIAKQIEEKHLPDNPNSRNTCWAEILENVLSDVLSIWFTKEFLIISDNKPIQQIFKLLHINSVMYSQINLFMREQTREQIRTLEGHDIEFNEKLILIDTIINDGLQFPKYDNTIQPFVQLARHNERRSQYLFNNKLKKYLGFKNSRINSGYDDICIREYVSLFNTDMISKIPIYNNVSLRNVPNTYNSYIADKIFERYEGFDKNIANLVTYIKTMKMESYAGQNIKIHEMILKKFTPMDNGLFRYNEVEYTLINENNLYTFFGFINRSDKNMVSGDIDKIKTMTAIFYGKDHYMFVIANAQCDNTLKEYAEKNIFLNQSLYLIKYIIDTNRWTVNDKTAIINPPIRDFPFMIFAPCNCLKIMYESDGFFNLFTWGVIEDPSQILGKETVFNALDLNISSNLIIPIFNTNNLLVLKTMYSNFGAYDMILNSLGVAQLIWNKLPKDISPSESDAPREYMKFYNTRESNGYKYIPNIAKLHEICKKDMDIKLNSWNYIGNDDIADNMPECVKLLVKKVKSHISIDYNKMKEISDTLNYNTHMTEFLERNPVIKINQGETIHKEEILECIEYLKSQINLLNNKLRYKDDDNLLNFIYENAQVLLNIIQINLMIRHLYAINKIVIDNEEIGKYKFEIFESSSNMEIPRHIPDVQTLIFMIYFGNFLKTEQLDKYNKMITSMNNDRELFPVHHIMMGKGKSAVITPLIVINSEIKNKKSYVIVPVHLFQQTSDTFDVINQIFNLTKVTIIDDNNAKHLLLENKFDSNDSILIMDEIDMMLNPLQSTYQISIDKKNLDKKLAKNMLDVLKLLHSNKGNSENIKSQPANITPFLLEEITTVYNSSYVKNINYGMSRENKPSTNGYYSRIAIPYARKDSPLEKSEFSSIIVSFVLSFKYFYENMSLERNDLYNIWRSKDADIIDLFSSDLIEIPDDDHFISRAQKIYNLLNEETKIYIIDLYLEYCVFPMIKISGDVRTCSTVDIMGMDDIFWEIGYSGTIDVDFPQVKADCGGCKGFHNHIDIDYDEQISMNMIFKNKDIYENTYDNKFEGVRDIDQLWNHIRENLDNRYSMLIDLAGLLKDMDNLSVVKYIAKLYDQSRSYIYLDNKNNKYIYESSNDTSKKYNGQEFRSDDVFYYYSQQHTVGIDFKQPAQMRCLLLINTRNTLTETAQALWRARKMIRGHYVTVLLHSPDYMDAEITGGFILDMLTHNSRLYRENQKGLLDYQNIKWLTRKQLHSDDKYLEPAIPIKYILNQEPDTSELKQIAITSITRSTELHRYIESSSLFASLCSRPDFKNIVLGTNTTQFVADARNEVDIDINTIAHSRSVHTYNMPSNKKLLSIVPWCFMPSENLESEISEYTNQVCTFMQNENSCSVVYSSELFNDIYNNINIMYYSSDSHTDLPDISLVKLLPTVYLLANPTIMTYCYNKFLIYNVHGILLNKYGKLANDNQVKEGNEIVKFPEYIKILSGNVVSRSKFDVTTVPKKMRSLIFLLIKNGLLPVNIKDIFPHSHKRQPPEFDLERELGDLISKTNNACKENRESICKKIIEYADDYTELSNKATEDDLRDIFKLYKLPEDQADDHMVSGGGYNITQISEYYKKYTTIKNKYLQLKSRFA